MSKRIQHLNRVCIVIPAYNEGPVIGDVVRNAIGELRKTKYEFEIVVVNDGSRDTTGEESRKAGAHVIDHILNSGAGGATATGLSYAQQNSFDAAATMDADGQHLVSDVIEGFSHLEQKNADLLIGSRLINSEGMSRVKVIGNKGLSFVTYLLFGINSTDSQSGLRIFSRKSLEQLRWRTSGYEFCSEMLWRAKQLSLSIDEFPIKAVYTDYSKAKGQNNWNAINIIKSLIKRRLTEILG